MTTTGEDRVVADREAWARSTLEIDADATTETVRRTIVERIGQSDFVPPRSWREAITLLGDRPAPSTDCFDGDRSRELAEEVSLFAENFFALSVEERKQRWLTLRERAEGLPAIEVRLERLGPGLGVDLTTLEQGPGDEFEGYVRDLGRFVGRLFVASPGERARLRREWLAENGRDRRLRPAIRRLSEAHQDVAELDPEFVRARPSTGSVIVEPSTVDRETRRAYQPVQTAASDVGGGSSGWGGAGIAVVVLIILRLALAVGRTSSSYDPPSYKPTYAPPPKLEFTPDDVRRSEVHQALLGIDTEHFLTNGGIRMVRTRFKDGEVTVHRWDPNRDSRWKGPPAPIPGESGRRNVVIDPDDLLGRTLGIVPDRRDEGDDSDGSDP